MGAFVLGWQAHRGFLSWAAFAMFNGILDCCWGLAGSILVLTGNRVLAYS